MVHSIAIQKARMAEGEQSNYEILRDCVSSPIIKHHALPEPKQRKRKVHKSKSGSKSNHRSDAEAIKEDGEEDGMGAAAEDLAEFIDVLPLSSHDPALSPWCFRLKSQMDTAVPHR